MSKIIVTQSHIAACYRTWKSCESLLLNLQLIKDQLSTELVKTVDECAHISMATYYAFKSQSVNSSTMALLCIGICEECSTLCSVERGSGFSDCAQVCRSCSDALSDFILLPDE